MKFARSVKYLGNATAKETRKLPPLTQITHVKIEIEFQPTLEYRVKPDKVRCYRLCLCSYFFLPMGNPRCDL